jgi:eukaryotic-like serine/threonine-protein kinase
MSGQRYSVLDKIDVGGMAEVWRGKAVSLQGFEKLIAIKRVLPDLAENERFMRMFLDEARLSLSLNHANIVQTFDIGVSDNTYFIVMEWIDGANLKTICETAVEQGFRIPREQAVFILTEVCKGLSHAHQRRDEDGNFLGVVHRDISPPNVLISREGEVKLVDFGLAKAKSQLSPTDPGVVKGKFGYLCPEGARGQVVDHRADIFSAGIVLWEMLAGRRLFEGPDNLATVQLVRAAEIPPLAQFNPDVDHELEAIIHKALALDPDQRFQNSEQFGHELSRYLFSNQLMVTSYDIAVLVKRVMAERSLTRPMRIVGHDTIAGTQKVEGELGAFVSLEELEQMSFVSVSASHPEVTENDLSVDPRSWADEFDLDHGHPSLSEETTTGEPDESVTRLHTFPLGFLEEIQKDTFSTSPVRDATPLPETRPPQALIPREPAYSEPTGLEPIIQRVEELSDSPDQLSTGRVSLIDFGPTKPKPISEPQTVEKSADRSIIYGVLAGLAGAAMIIYMSWYLFD